MRDPRYLLPDPTDGYQGSRGSRIFLIALTVLTTGRSLAHMFLDDGGANSIAGNLIFPPLVAIALWFAMPSMRDRAEVSA